MRVEQTVTIDAPSSDVWEHVTDPVNIPSFLEGVTRWEVAGDKERGLGARYSVRMKVGTAHMGGLIEIVEYDEARDIAWTSVTGVDQRGRWRLRSRKPGQTQVTLRMSFSLAGGLLSRITERIAVRVVDANMRRSMENLKAQLEA